MTTLTVHLEDSLLKRTQQIAEARHTTVDDVVAGALEEISKASPAAIEPSEDYETRYKRLEAAMARYSGWDTGGPYTRDELNER